MNTSLLRINIENAVKLLIVVGIIIFIYPDLNNSLTIMFKNYPDKAGDLLLAVSTLVVGAMEMIDSPKTNANAIGIMAKKSGISSEEFESLMFDTEIFTKPKKAVDFMGTDGKGKLYTFAQKVQEFLVNQKILEKQLDLTEFVNPRFVIEYYNSL